MNRLQFNIVFTEDVCKEKLDGRLLLMVSTNDLDEPRFQVNNYPETQLIFGKNVDDLQPGQDVTFDDHVPGYPLSNLGEIPSGEYWVQALLHKYETFNRTDGHKVKLPMDRGEGQKWNKAPGNLFSTPKKVEIDRGTDSVINIKLDQEIPPFEEPVDTRYIKHVKIKSKLLSGFWDAPCISEQSSSSLRDLKNARAKRVHRPSFRTTVGEVLYSLRDEAYLEHIKGDRCRGGGQWDIWTATYSPVDEDGYPKPLFDRVTGEIDSETAQYWKENYDLRYILERDWETLGPKLKNKIRIYCGDMDSHYLNNSVYLMEEFLENTEKPYYKGLVDYGDRISHCYYGDNNTPSSLDRYVLVQRHAKEMANHITLTAPNDADTKSWKY